MKFLRLREWAKYQHYRNRNPPWIKLHGELLGSYAWVTLDEAGRLLAVVCMLLAARTGNKIPLDRDYIQRAAYMKKRPDVRPLVECGFAEVFDDVDVDIENTPLIEVVTDELAHASTMLADSEKCLPRGRGEEEGEEETEKEKAGAHPTIEQIKAYCLERQNQVDPEKWLSYYQSNGWYVGRCKMKDWKASVRYWEKRGFGGSFSDGHKTAAQRRNEQQSELHERVIREIEDAENVSGPLRKGVGRG